MKARKNQSKRVAEINARGWANGWHAQQLQEQAKRQGVDMATQFVRNIAGASAFNVFAKAVRVTAEWVYYEFADGSTAQFLNQKGSK